jgi:drug/metabolite transporter (DMT)-like permease
VDRRAWTLLLSLAAIWGASYMFIKIGLRDLSPAMVAWSRIALAAAVLVGIAAYRRQLRLPGVSWVDVTLLGAVSVAGPFLLIGVGEEEVSSSLAGILIAATPLFTALLAIRLDHEERADGMRLAGVVLGLAGVALVLGVDLGGTTQELLGGAMIILAGLGYSVGSFMTKRHVAAAPPTTVAAWVMVASMVLMAPVAAASLPGDAPGAGPLAAVLALGLVGTGIAFVLFYELVSAVGPTRTFIVSYLAPAFAVLYGGLLLDEPVGVATIAGLVLILGGSYLAVEGRAPWHARRVPVAPQTPPDACAASTSSGAGR